uniref:Uncharacterized protein n=1 Tax=Cannabis sativa TaxID=3483 RepID=A0A803NHM5_CANSA
MIIVGGGNVAVQLARYSSQSRMLERASKSSDGGLTHRAKAPASGEEPTRQAPHRRKSQPQPGHPGRSASAVARPHALPKVRGFNLFLSLPSGRAATGLVRLLNLLDLGVPSWSSSFGAAKSVGVGRVASQLEVRSVGRTRSFLRYKPSSYGTCGIETISFSLKES